MSRVFLAEERRLVLNVEAVLEGKIRRYGDNLQISASLTSAENGTEPWSQSG